MIHKLLIKLVMLALFLSPLASAQPPRGGPGAEPGGPRGQAEGPGPGVSGNNLAPPQIDAAPAVTRQQALDLARDRFQGRVLSVRLVDNDWRIRVDQNGTVFNVFVDGRTGQVNRAAD